MKEILERAAEDDLKKLVMRLGGDAVAMDGLDQVISVGDILAYWSPNGYPSTYRISKVIGIKAFQASYMNSPAMRVKVRSVYVYRNFGLDSDYKPPQLSKRSVSLESLYKTIVVKPDMVRPDVLALLSKIV